MITRRKSLIALLAAAVAFTASGQGWAQEASVPAPPAPQIGPSLGAPQTGPADPSQAPAGAQEPTVPWGDWLGREGHNPPRNSVNAWQRSVSEDGDTLRREHTVTNPADRMTQTWERSRTEEGYQLEHRQTWTAPDGTVLRQHEMTFSGTDPYNYQRQKTITLPHGRTMTMEQSRTWDGVSGTMQRTFTGPNGQTQTFEHSWSPENTVRQQRPATGEDTPAKEGFWAKLNPFRRSNAGAGKLTSAPGRRWGFTVGAGGPPKLIGQPRGLAKKQPGHVVLPGRAAAKGRASMKHGPDAAPGLQRAKLHGGGKH
jgi:hypothetical protein